MRRRRCYWGGARGWEEQCCLHRERGGVCHLAFFNEPSCASNVLAARSEISCSPPSPHIRMPNTGSVALWVVPAMWAAPPIAFNAGTVHQLSAFDHPLGRAHCSANPAVARPAIFAKTRIARQRVSARHHAAPRKNVSLLRASSDLRSKELGAFDFISTRQGESTCKRSEGYSWL